MPFDYQKFDQQCATMSTDQLLAQHKHYTKLSAGAMTSTVVSGLSIPLTLGLSGFGIAASAPAHHNAKKKKIIVEKYLKARGIEGTQATQYANALSQQQQDQKMWMDQQSMQNANKQGAGPSSDSQRTPSDQKYNYSDPRDSKKGPMKNPSDDMPPPPPTYDESLSGPSNGYPQQRQQSPQGYGSPQPQYSMPPQQQQQQSPRGYGSPSGQYGMPPQQQGWGQPQGGYMSPPMGYGYNGQGYCSPQNHLYPNSAMYHPRPG